MKKRLGGCHGTASGRRRSVVWIAAGVVLVAVLAGAPWMVRNRTPVQAAPATSAPPLGDLRQRTAELIGYASSVRLTLEQQKVKTEALSGIPAPCGKGNSLAVRCCGCNLYKSITGLANHMIAREGADATRVRPAVLEWIALTNPGSYSGAACDRKRCERPFHEDGCGGMSEARLVF